VRIAYLGPAGTFTEAAVLSQDDLRTAELVPMGSIRDALAATAEGSVDAGFVPIENAIEGTVSDTQDTLAGGAPLVIQREVIIPVQLHLLGVPGADLGAITTVMSHPHALGQCRGFLDATIPDAVLEATNSTADAARLLGASGESTTAAIATSRAAEIYNLEILAADIEDHPDNATRFILVATGGVPAPTGHDKTSVVIFQRADTPGSLLAILQEFAVRAINLTHLESRPTRKGLGDYCFLVDIEGHIADEVVADALRSLKAKQHDVRFLGSYPASGSPRQTRPERTADQQAADTWMADLKTQIQQ
jgi:prephenate dehydratase